MSARHAYQKASDSKSLWNYTLSPGFTKQDVRVLRLAIIRHGCGSWQKIKPHFPEKNNGQLNLQCQKLFGQQSLAAWSGVHVDPLVIKLINDEKVVPLRKNGCIINTGRNMTQALKKKLKQENTDNYGLPQAIYKRIKVPVLKVDRPIVTQNDQVRALGRLYQVYDILSKKVEKMEKGEWDQFLDENNKKKKTEKKENDKGNSNDNGDNKNENKKEKGKGKAKPKSTKSKKKSKAKIRSTRKPKQSAKKKKAVAVKQASKDGTDSKEPETVDEGSNSNNNSNDSSNNSSNSESQSVKPKAKPGKKSTIKNKSRKRKTFMSEDEQESDDPFLKANGPPPAKKAKMMKSAKKSEKAQKDDE